MDTAFAILLVMFIASFAVGLVIQYIFLSRLRSRHAKTWETLGCPTLFLNNSIRNSLAILRFLWSREYRALSDPPFVRLAGFLRSYLAAYFVLFLSVIALLAVKVINEK
jgi:branched-subunit amino acid ABC-type transport system permease component